MPNVNKTTQLHACRWSERMPVSVTFCMEPMSAKTHTHEHTHTYSGKEWNFHHQNDTITSIVFHTFPLAHSMIIFPNRRHKSKCSESERNLSWTQLENFYQQIHNQHHHLLIVFINLPTN